MEEKQWTHETVVNKMQHAEGSSTLGLHRYKHWRYVTHRMSADVSSYHGSWSFTFFILKLCIHGLRKVQIKCPGHSGFDWRKKAQSRLLIFIQNSPFSRIRWGLSLPYRSNTQVDVWLALNTILCCPGFYLILMVLKCTFRENFWASPDHVYDFL